jgi:hypothetical protein
MSGSTSVRAILEAAEQAAAAGDVDAAGELLRQAVPLQEAELGRQHPDLANTLNNLGVVSEKTGRLDEAAACYRRAFEIAVAAFEPGHPFVITSRKNLEEFREAHGAAVEPPPVAAVAAPTVAPAASPPATQRRFPVALLSTLIIGVLAVLVLGVIVLRRSNAPPASTLPPPSAASTPSESTAAKDAAVPSTAAPPTDPGSAPREAAPRSATRGDTAGAAKRPARGGSARAAVQPTVAEAQVCRTFSPGSPEWRCERAGTSVAPGSLVYYTRIKAAIATTVEHRWYHRDGLQQRVVLDVAANSTAGYRTYSRLAVMAPGPWRVELRTESGAVLHEERFSVR